MKRRFLSHRVFFWLVATLFLLFTVAIAVRSPRETPHRMLFLKAIKNGYHVFGDQVAVPPTTFSLENLNGWRELFEKREHPNNPYHFDLTIEEKVLFIFVGFYHSDQKIDEVAIIWKDDRDRTWRFPYQINERETKNLVHKAISLMKK